MSEVVTKKKCPGCEQDLPLGEFYVAKTGKHGRATYCKTCENSRKRPATSGKVNRNRARHRAVSDLIDAHPEEFEEYFAARLREAEIEAVALTAAAADLPRHNHAPVVAPKTPQPVRLKSGPRRDGQSIAERIDVARCGECQSHHDRGHKCLMCGSSPETRRRPAIVSAAQIMADIHASGGESLKM